MAILIVLLAKTKKNDSAAANQLIEILLADGRLSVTMMQGLSLASWVPSWFMTYATAACQRSISDGWCAPVTL